MDHPIYIGKADPDNQAAKDAVSQGTKLSARLNEHARSIRKASTTLNIDDFECASSSCRRASRNWQRTI